LRYLHIDTGAMYRAAAYAVIRNNIDPHDQDAVEALVGKLRIRLERSNGAEVLLDGEPVTGAIRSSEVTAVVSTVSSYPGVRSKMVDEQREIGRNGGVVLEGRDIGTVVFPDADLKFFFIADPEERARRRYRELIDKGERVEYDTVLKDIQTRDAQDTAREVSPLRKADDAITIDTSDMSIEGQINAVLEIVTKRSENKSPVNG
jgi:CMP/dCMP kinase